LILNASLYIAGCSAKNRVAVRLRRLREPRYLIGALLAAAYFFFIFVAPRRGGRRRGPPEEGLPSALEQFGVPLGGLGILLLSTVAWILPSRSHLFSFTDAEVALLFPAPVSRRQLLVHRLIRSQVSLVFAAMVPVLLVAGSGALTSVGERLLIGIGLWVVLATTRVYFAGVTMARDHLGSNDRMVRGVAWAPLLVMLAALAVVGAAIARVVTLPVALVPATLAQISDVTTTGWASVALLPFRLLLGPFFAQGAVQYLTALAGSVLVLLAAVVWVIESDRVFQRVRAGLGAPLAARRGPTLRGAGWSLPLTGRTETLFFWKNAQETLRATNVRSLIPIAILILYAVVGARFAMSTGMAPAICFAALMMAGFVTMIGPGSVMGDLRGDLRHLELLKTWPVKASAVLRGELLWPGVLISACAWLALTCAVVLSGAAFPQVPFVWRLSLYVVALVLVPTLVFSQYVIHQAAAVLFPAWVPTDNEMRGFEAAAQRLILFAGVVLALVVMVGPGAIAGGIVSFAFFRLTGSPLVFVPGALVCLAVVAIEVVLATEALGAAYDRIDLSGVERAEYSRSGQ
jgi:hypothetical protein